tara:strand:+ start:583 stop:759 length:177 start_codon:yes stop_codon:yes gene_type:complete
MFSATYDLFDKVIEAKNNKSNKIQLGLSLWHSTQKFPIGYGIVNTGFLIRMETLLIQA